ncbi:unnamed protein product [Vicia faba]|uniref:Uncharacterized protein n=1 Tax=Vicia faba TaxID=3906 RepID=A0AAV0ZUW7_VICFA|nr:unnamed protein product [Vicia faba]
MKKWVGTHTCGRVLNNSYVNSKWVVKTVAARMTSSDGVKIRDIVFEIRSNFFVVAFEETQLQPNLAEIRLVTSAQIPASTSVHSEHVTSTQSAYVTSSQADSGIPLYVPDYILTKPVPTFDDVPTTPVSTTPRVLKPVEFIIPFDVDLELFC